MSDLQQDYDNYWKRRKAIRARQRKELEDELGVERRALAASIWSERRSNGLTVQDVADKLNLRNRNFIYSILRDEPLVDLEKSTESKSKAKKAKPEPEFYLTYSIGKGKAYNMLNVAVTDTRTSDTEIYDIERDTWGAIRFIPETWYADDLTDEERTFYKDLIKAVENV